MIHLKIADKTLLVGDHTADLLIDYAALLGRIQSADNVKVNAVGADGDAVEANLLLNGGTVMVAETTHSSLPEPDNSEAERYIRSRLSDYADPSAADFEAADPFSEHA